MGACEEFVTQMEKLWLSRSVPDPEEHMLTAPRGAKVNLAVIVGHHARAKGAYSPWIGSEWDFHKDNVAPLLSDAAQGTGCNVKIFLRDPKTGSISEVARRVNAWAKANEPTPTLALSLHFNSFSTSQANGTETLYANASKVAEDWASEVQTCMLNCLGLKNRGVKPIRRGGRGSTILYETSITCALLEPGFGSNRRDAKAMKKHWPTLAPQLITSALKFAN